MGPRGVDGWKRARGRQVATEGDGKSESKGRSTGSRDETVMWGKSESSREVDGPQVVVVWLRKYDGEVELAGSARALTSVADPQLDNRSLPAKGRRLRIAIEGQGWQLWTGRCSSA